MKLRYLLPVVAGFAALGATAALAANGPSFFAVVDADGTLNRGLHALHAKHLTNGHYEVGFTRDVSACSYTASVGLSGDAGSSSPGIVSVAARSGKPKAIFVETFTPDGTRIDRGFHVIVAC